MEAWKKSYQKIKDWCNANQGLLTLLGLIVAIIALVPFNKVSFKDALPFFEKVRSILVFEIKIPLYLLVAVLMTSTFYFLRIKSRYSPEVISLKNLKGTWRCDWGENAGSEIFKLNENGNYIIGRTHMFDLTEFAYNPKTNEITFYKTAVREDDDRKVFNKVLVKNNELLEGLESTYKIKYTKISD